MRLVLRPVGNSVGVIIPKSALTSWGVKAGDSLELTATGIRPPRLQRNARDVLDELELRLAAAVVSRFSANAIRAHGLANLHRWKKNDVWASAYDEWKRILQSGEDGELFATMLGRDETANRLRQSPPYAGMLPRAEVERIKEEASA